METGNMKVQIDIATQKYLFTVIVTEFLQGSITTYEVYIDEPAEYCTVNRIAQPLTMMYDPDTDSLKFVYIPALPILKELESKLSDEIIKYNDKQTFE